MTVLLPLLAFFSLLLLTGTAYQVSRSRAATREMVARRLEGTAQVASTDSGAGQSLLHEKTYSDIPQLNRLLGRSTMSRNLDRMVIQAGFRVRAGEMLLWMTLLGMGSALVALLVKGSVLVALVVFVALGPGGGLWWLKRRRNARRHLIVSQLPDTLEMIRGALQAGYSLPQALESVHEEASDPIRSEIRQVTDELRLGHTMRASFQGLYDRTGVSDLRFFIIAVLLNREIGGNLSAIIDVVALTVRERFKLKAQVRALTSQGRFSALILCLLSPALLAALTFLNPEYLEPLYHTSTGNMALLYAASSTAFGYYLMRRIVDIKLVRTD